MHETAQNASLLALRCALGLMLVAHGANKIFGSGGIEGTTRWFASLGLRPARLHAVLAATTEVGSGALMISGAFMPLTAAAYVGLMIVAAVTDHRGKGFFVFAGGWEYVAFVAVVALCVVGLGPGRWSLDAALGLHLDGLGWSAAALGAGALGAALLVVLGRGSDKQVSFR